MNGFSVWIGLGAALGLWRVARNAPKRFAETWVDIGILVLIAALMGARLFYTGINWPYFSIHFLEIPQVWLGGLSWPGAVAGAGLAMVYVVIKANTIFVHAKETYYKGQSTLGWVGDRLYPLLPSIVITAWLGCWQAGIAYGPVSPEGAWWSMPMLDERGVYNLRFPVQPLAAATLILFFILLERYVKPRRPAGRLSGLAVLGVLTHFLLFSFLRADPMPRWNGLRMDTWFASIYLLMGLAFLAVRTLRPWIIKHFAFSKKRLFIILNH